MLAEGAVQRSRTASVLVTNPTHLAIAILYEDEKTPLPMVTAKGEGALAERMIVAAREAGVPVMQNIPLAHALFDEAAVDQYIPSDLIEPVAAVLRRVREISSGSTEPQWPST
jgi:type III secretion protein U